MRSITGIVLALCCTAVATAEPVFLPQNWSAHDRSWFYHVNQGSQLINYRLFLHLETPAGGERFRSDQHLKRYGFIPAPVSQYNPDRLPIGFARDQQALGLTCAACHTSELVYNNRRIRIDGGQAHIDLQRFLADLEAALVATSTDPARQERLFRRAGWDAESGARVLAAALSQRRFGNAQNASALAYGPSRLDAFGAILNKGLALAGGDNNRNEPNGPTSYPYLWDTPQHDWVEWNGSSPNPKEGALARNVGEVLGVYGTVDPRRTHILGLIDTGYRSSVRLRALRRIEKRVHKLQSPQWPERWLPAIDRDLAARGKPLYETYCGGCHLPIERDDPARRIQVRMSSLQAAGTDPVMARNVLDAMGASGRFAGEKRFYVAGDAIEERAPALYIVNHVMGGVIRNHALEALLAFRDARAMGQGNERHPPKYLDGDIMPRGTETSATALAAYKARPLNGIWATAPYLHNGSVPNLYELLLPAAERSTQFALGGWRFDPLRVGYATGACEQDFTFDTSLPGNSNAGHEYGTGADGREALDESARLALLEYLKTL